MAEIVLKYNTADKTTTCTVDGAEIADVHGAMIGKDYEGRMYCDVSTRRKDKDSGITYMTMLMAAESESARANVNAAPSEIPGFVEVRGESAARAGLKNLLSKGRR